MRRYLELAVLLLTIYSLVTLVVELEAPGAEEWPFLVWSERAVAVLFTVEYAARWAASRSWRYPLRPLAVIDLLAVLPFYLGFLVDLRALRLLRVARVLRLFKLYRHTAAALTLWAAFRRVRYELGVVGFAVLTLGAVGSVAVLECEREAQPGQFGRLSDAAWYTIATLTTVGYGDKVPVTAGGRLVAAGMMVVGLALYGTFVSLIGTSFLEELRRGREAGASTPVPVPPAPG